MIEPTALYVYYTVDAAQHADCAVRVRQFQARLQDAWPGLGCELMQRPEAAAGAETWMEVYRHADGIPQTLIQHIGETAAADNLPAPRHSERFVPLR